MSRHNASIKALHKMMLKNPHVIPPEKWPKHIKEITGKNHRLIGVVCGAMVEFALETLLRKFLPNCTEDLFDHKGGALGTFAAKIEIAYGLGLIDQDIRRNANYIREIRNVFAHRIAPTSFNDPEIANVCKLLVLNFPGFPTVKNPCERYSRTTLQTSKAITRRRAFGWDAQPATLQ